MNCVWNGYKSKFVRKKVEKLSLGRRCTPIVRKERSCLHGRSLLGSTVRDFPRVMIIYVI